MKKDLLEEIEKLKKEYKEKRKKYDRCVMCCNTALSSIPVLIIILLIFSDRFGESSFPFKDAALLLCILSIMINHVSQNGAYGAKLIQRGTTYFALCNLEREIEFAVDLEKRYEEFSEKLQDIMKHDNEMSLSNSLATVDLLYSRQTKNLELENSIQQKVKK